ncbi:hypothetical protein SDC9_110894 [bioreactor metagenome]|uniref:Uncharacterized protein n=1 Tax=bioreactor metagenome TaxID=1076179 RepID=A0A645BEY3_9ZZZZ
MVYIVRLTHPNFPFVSTEPHIIGFSEYHIKGLYTPPVGYMSNALSMVSNIIVALITFKFLPNLLYIFIINSASMLKIRTIIIFLSSKALEPINKNTRDVNSNDRYLYKPTALIILDWLFLVTPFRYSMENKPSIAPNAFFFTL